MKNSKKITSVALAMVMLASTVATPVNAAIAKYITEKDGVLYSYDAQELQEEILNTLLGEESKMYEKYLTEKLAYVEDDKVGYVVFEELEGKILDKVLDGEEVKIDEISESGTEVKINEEIKPVNKDCDETELKVISIEAVN